jgi:hypothetical protein
MITTDNPYRRLLTYHSTPDWPDACRLDEFLRPCLQLQSYAFRDGALIQLLACLADLRNWAAQNRFLREEQRAWTIDEIAGDWEKEIQKYIKIE